MAIYIFPNISRSKGNQAIKFGQLIEYNIGTFLLKNHTQNVVEKLFPVVEKLFPDPYLKICLFLLYFNVSFIEI